LTTAIHNPRRCVWCGVVVITLVVTDIGMSVIDGYELFRELKKLKPELPIIVSSGFGNTEVTARISRDDIAGLVSKFYNFEQMLEVLKRVVDSLSISMQAG